MLMLLHAGVAVSTAACAACATARAAASVAGAADAASAVAQQVAPCTGCENHQCVAQTHS